jgi:methyl-accepting chemotaxis protein
VSKEGNFFEQYIQTYGYYDLFLIHPDGEIFYTVKHEADYRTNILSGEYANSGLGQLVKRILTHQKIDMSDYALYAPSHNEPAAFVAEPLLLGQNNTQLIVALQLDDTALNSIMSQRAGLGKTGEAYLVGSDQLMRSNSLNQAHYSIKNSLANPTLYSVNTEAVRAVLERDETNTAIVVDYRDQWVLSAYTPLKIGEIRWALLAEIDKDEVFAPIKQLQWKLIQFAVIATVLIIIISLWIIYTIKRPLNDLVTLSQAIASGNLNNDIPTKNKNEVGQLLLGFSTMQTQLRERFQENQKINQELQERFAEDKRVAEEINLVTQMASQGDFSQRINLNNKEGTFKAIGESINRVLDFNQLAITDLMRVFSAIANGNLTQTIVNDYSGELARLKNDTNATINKLIEVLTIIKQSAEIVSIAAKEISEGNFNLSQRTTQQAASLEETAASMEQMTSTVQQNADNAKQANQLAISARDHAEQGHHVVGQAVVAINEINKSSKKINEITTVIDEIAFQTNLLALNAAVEAARAGEYGRGFAVVATEVRTLAQRSAAAAKEIKGLIQDSNLKVEEGTRLVHESGQVLAEIVRAVKKVGDIIAEIAAASTEQSLGIQQVNKAVAQMDEMVEQNSALVEEGAAASESMEEQAQELKRQVEFFSMASRAAVEQPNGQKRSVMTRKPVTTIPKQISKKTDPENKEDWQDF